MKSKSDDGLETYILPRSTPRTTGSRKSYDPPILRTLRSEQATLFLVGHAYEGDQAAKEILEILFPGPVNKPPL